MRLRHFAAWAIAVASAAAAHADNAVPEEAKMAPWTRRCVERLERAEKDFARGRKSFQRDRLGVEDGAVVWSATDGDAGFYVRIAPTSPSSPARNSWNPPRDQWTHLPIIDKSYSLTKLNLFRWNDRLEAGIGASRADDSPRAPPIPKWLARFVAVMQPAVEECLDQRAR
ncbi:MAG TPA: hypothetical protein VFF06_11390 [Polyangia bacterium]|nr:hypothetical protein [Polyangia bacterium]